MTNKKRIWCLYRVSTKKQTDTEDDIPIQRTACHNYVNSKPDWEITNELYEKGISGWKKTVNERDALSIIRQGALEEKFDILLVYMLDRLGRREDETPLVVSFLYEKDIEVWSVQEGKRSVESHVDKLITYIGFWQSSGESLKTSIRVKESKKQLSEQGYFQGGVAPYGYKIFTTDQIHWKDKDRFLKVLVPDEYESKVVELIFDLYTNSHCGYRKIADILNEKGYRARNGKEIRVSSIRRILINPVCIGLKNYKSFDEETKTQPYNENLRIVSDEIYYKAEEIRTKRKKSIKKQDKSGIPLSGKLMVSGLGYCGYCGEKLSGNYLYRDSVAKRDNKTYEYRTIIYRYRCPLNKGSKSIPHEKNTWGGKKFDKLITNMIKIAMGSIDVKKFIDVNLNKKQELVKNKQKTLKNLEKEKEALQKKLEKLNSEIASSLIGGSVFTPEQLSSAINSLNKQIEDVSIQSENLSSEIEINKNNNNDVNNIALEIKNWESKYDDADENLKKAMISRIIDKVEFFDEDVNIHFNFQIKELLNQGMKGLK